MKEHGRTLIEVDSAYSNTHFDAHKLEPLVSNLNETEKKILSLLGGYSIFQAREMLEKVHRKLIRVALVPDYNPSKQDEQLAM